MFIYNFVQSNKLKILFILLKTDIWAVFACRVNISSTEKEIIIHLTFYIFLNYMWYSEQPVWLSVSVLSKVVRTEAEVREAAPCCCSNTSFCSLIRTLAHKKPLGLWLTKDPTDLWVIGQLEWSTGERRLVSEFWLANQLAPPL